MSDAQHTPTPWFVNQCGIYSENPANEKPGTPMGHALIACTGDDGDEHQGQEQLANAAFIVKCCNEHADLVRQNIAADDENNRLKASNAELVECVRLLLESLGNSHPKKALPALYQRHAQIEERSNIALANARKVQS